MWSEGLVDGFGGDGSYSGHSCDLFAMDESFLDQETLSRAYAVKP